MGDLNAADPSPSSMPPSVSSSAHNIVTIKSIQQQCLLHGGKSFGTFENRANARILCQFYLSRGVPATVRARDGGYDTAAGTSTAAAADVAGRIARDGVTRRSERGKKCGKRKNYSYSQKNIARRSVSATGAGVCETVFNGFFEMIFTVASLKTVTIREKFKKRIDARN